MAIGFEKLNEINFNLKSDIIDVEISMILLYLIILSVVLSDEKLIIIS